MAASFLNCKIVIMTDHTPKNVFTFNIPNKLFTEKIILPIFVQQPNKLLVCCKTHVLEYISLTETGQDSHNLQSLQYNYNPWTTSLTNGK